MCDVKGSMQMDVVMYLAVFQPEYQLDSVSIDHF
jgi:hypothetical protein